MSRRSPLVLRVARATALAVACGFGQVPAPGQGCPCGTAADEFRAADAGLVREWIVQVPFDSATWRLERVVVGDGLVVASSGDGGLHAIRSTASGSGAPRAGTVAWSRWIDAAGGHAWPPTIGTRLVVLSSETAVHAIDRDTGVVEWERPTGSLTATAAVQAGDWVYQPLQTNRVLRLPVNPLGEPASEPPPEATAAGRRGARPAAVPMPPESREPLSIEAGGRLAAPPGPLGPGVFWATSNGLVALERTPLGWVRHQLPEAARPTWERRPPVTLAGPPVLRGSSIFIATAGGALARIDLNAQNKPGLRTVWTASLSDRASSGPMIADDVVLVELGPAGIAAFSADDGDERWRADLVGTLVAVAGGRAWLLDQVGRLTALDLASGSRRQSLCVGCFTLPVVNTATRQLLLASPSGVLVSLAPPASPAPPARPVSGGEEPVVAPGPVDPAATPP